VARELAGVCQELGKADEAVAIGQKAAALKPDNAQTLGNLACAYLFASRLNEAEATLRAARAIDPNDGVNRSIARMVEEVRSGRRPQPKRLRDLTRGPQASDERQTQASVAPRRGLCDSLQFWKRRS
jgi:Flp pilus assembly protein TadD